MNRGQISQSILRTKTTMPLAMVLWSEKI